MRKIPATVVTGFLGAGKTTLIRHLLENAGGRRIALVINEFGDLGVDGDILKGCGVETCREEDVVELTNGCICCTVADDFVPTMEKLLERADRLDHIVIETSGFPASSAMCLDLVRKEGKLAHIGWANDLPPLPVVPIMAKTLTVFGIGGNGGRGQYERALELVRTGRFDLDPVVTHRFSLDDVAEAFATAASKADGAIKVVVTP